MVAGEEKWVEFQLLHHLSLTSLHEHEEDIKVEQ
jgi:hypothetical protein